MAISKQIITKIYKLDIDENEKELLINILEWQEHGTSQYSNKYELFIKEYLEKKEK